MFAWYVPSERQLRWYEREGEAVVFNPQSGRSHFLNALTNEVLRFIEAGPRSAADIQAHIETIVEDGDVSDLDQHIRSILNGFELQGLVDPWQA